MSYYRDKRRAMKYLETLLKAGGGTMDSLIYQVTTNHEVGNLTVKNHVKLLCRLKKVEKDLDVYKWKTKETDSKEG